MSIHYLINPFTSNGDIIDVKTPENGQSDATGAAVIRIPDGVSIDSSPSNLSELLTAKYDAILAANPGFTTIVADSCMDVSSFNTASLTAGALFSSGTANHCILDNGIVEAAAVDVTPDVPTQAVLIWEEYSFSDVNDKDGRMRRTYVEESGNNLTAFITFDGGTPIIINGTMASNGAVVNLGGYTGSSLIVGFINTSGSRVYLGSWAVIY
jgi:hypothetical protein